METTKSYQPNINESLKELYSSYWELYRENILLKVDAAFPFLVTAPDRYISSVKKVMFVGQETQSWNTEEYKNPSGATIESVCYRYDAFVNRGVYNSPYWNFQRKIQKLNPAVGFLSNNIVKIGKKHEAGCSDSIDDLAHQFFPVFMAEVKILKPNLIIFLTGPNYDWRIKRTMGDFSKQHIGEEDIFCDRLVFADPTLPDAIRINHPGWIVRNKLYHRMISVVNQYIKENL